LPREQVPVPRGHAVSDVQAVPNVSATPHGAADPGDPVADVGLRGLGLLGPDPDVPEYADHGPGFADYRQGFDDRGMGGYA
jgi:hypothetical protein